MTDCFVAEGEKCQAILGLLKENTPIKQLLISVLCVRQKFQGVFECFCGICELFFFILQDEMNKFDQIV